jgi:2-polyprenyl-3-methyl-5-hydroxy-6-metoxy-1,4-benzoquinol methylase
MSTKPRASGPSVGFRRGRTSRLISHATGVDASVSIIDIGGGASRLVDALISEGFKAVAVLDLSEKALATSKARLGAKGTQVQWIVADVTNWQLSQTYDVWHDRAALHFLTDPKDRFLPIRKTVLHTPSAFPKQCASAAT